MAELFRGSFDVVEGNVVARSLRRVFRLPPRGHAVPVSLRVTSIAGGQRWERTFGEHAMASLLTRRGEFLVERFGAIEFLFRLHSTGPSIRFEHVATNIRIGFVSLRVPSVCAPRVRADLREDDGIHVSVDVVMPVVGRILHYEGLTKECEP